VTRARVNPFNKGTAEHVLFNHYRRNKLEAERKEQEAALMSTDAAATRAKAEHYAEALRSLGHGDKVTPLRALPNYSGGQS
jgi:hypothetical protein